MVPLVSGLLGLDLLLQAHCFQNCSEHREKQEKRKTQDHINTGMQRFLTSGLTDGLFIIFYYLTSIQPGRMFRLCKQMVLLTSDREEALCCSLKHNEKYKTFSVMSTDKRVLIKKKKKLYSLEQGSQPDLNLLILVHLCI